jgi:nucleotide-binding universal stress UspA family protein
MNRILVATDGSDCANRALDYAARRAKIDGDELVIVNVAGGYDLPGKIFTFFTRAQQTWLQELFESASADTLNQARDRARDIGVETVHLELRSGEAAQVILDVAHERGVDGIVVGKRGAGQAMGLLLGSVSQKLVSLTDVPVTVVP